MKIKVTRTLVYEGSPEWIHRTLAAGAVQEDKPLTMVAGPFTITELPRLHEVVELDIGG